MSIRTEEYLPCKGCIKGMCYYAEMYKGKIMDCHFMIDGEDKLYVDKDGNCLSKKTRLDKLVCDLTDELECNNLEMVVLIEGNNVKYSITHDERDFGLVECQV